MLKILRVVGFSYLKHFSPQRTLVLLILELQLIVIAPWDKVSKVIHRMDLDSMGVNCNLTDVLRHTEVVIVVYACYTSGVLG